MNDDRPGRPKCDQGKWNPEVTRKEKAPQNEGLEVAATGLEHSGKEPEKQGVVKKRGTESGTVGGDSDFAAAMAAVMRLPLSDAEKAEAVRRLLRR